MVEAMYQGMIEEFGPIDEGGKSFREIKAPAQTDVNRKLPQTVRMILEAEATPEAVVQDIQQSIEHDRPRAVLRPCLVTDAPARRPAAFYLLPLTSSRLLHLRVRFSDTGSTSRRDTRWPSAAEMQPTASLRSGWGLIRSSARKSARRTRPDPGCSRRHRAAPGNRAAWYSALPSRDRRYRRGSAPRTRDAPDSAPARARP